MDLAAETALLDTRNEIYGVFDDDARNQQSKDDDE